MNQPCPCNDRSHNGAACFGSAEPDRVCWRCRDDGHVTRGLHDLIAEELQTQDGREALATENAALRARVEALEGALRELPAAYMAMKAAQDTPAWSSSVLRVSRAFKDAVTILAGGTAEKESAGVEDSDALHG